MTGETTAIRPLVQADRETYLAMCREFYASDAVLRPVPEGYFEKTFSALMAGTPYAAGYLIARDGQAAGYALLARTFSQEAGGEVLWIEELYIRPEFRGQGLGSEFFRFLLAHRPPAVTRLRLETEPENVRAKALYRRMGFSELGYDQMVLELPGN